MSYLREHVERFAPHSPLYRLLAEHGEEFTFTPLPEGESYGRAKQCYANATMRAISPFGDEDVTYYEGYCLDGGFPFAHAWCVRDGKVLDLTLRHKDTDCAFCFGEGELHPTDHWSYDPPEDEDEDEYIDEAETIPCEFCRATGQAKPVDRSEATYLGVPVDNRTLRRIVIEKGSFTCFDGEGFEMVLESLGLTLEALQV